MGVLPCKREGCEHIMCERYSHDFGYLCWECFNELVGLGVKTDIAAFLREKVAIDRNPDASRAYFDEIFPPQHGSE